MGILKVKEEALNSKTIVIKQVLEYFSSKEDDFPKEVIGRIAAAADNVYVDDILFEEFENWVASNDDDAFLYLINHYWDTKSMENLAPEKANLTGKEKIVEEIKNSARNEQAQKFSELLAKLTTERGLTTLDKIGEFLGVSAERARVMLEGKHRPQRKTLLKIANKFDVDRQDIFKQVL